MFAAVFTTGCSNFYIVYPDGRVCISILHTPGEDPLGYESATERWSPVQSIEKILLSVVSMLAGIINYISTEMRQVQWPFSTEPNDESGANVDASKMWRENRQAFSEIAKKLVRKSLGLS